MTRRTVVGAALLGVTLGVLVAAPARAQELVATLQWAQRVDLSTPVSGVIDQVHADVGDRVAAGERLLALDPRPFQYRIARLEAEVEGLKEERDEAAREHERSQALYDRTVLSTHELQLARIAFVQADADYKAAQARLADARLELERSVVEAPFDAVVVERRAQPGETVVSRLQSTPLLVVAEAGHMVARALVDAERAATLEAGQAAMVSVAGRSYEGTVRGIGVEPEGAGGEPRYPVEVGFRFDQPRVLRAGQAAEVRLP